ncbi:Uncharacterized protein ChrSV_3956 [Chromobacterium vaccinii]|nr:Uncharacterized protein ChrSW_3956 [Chromobacterium vaccinii]QND91413.1 Uncharacterized protein ChrSV_3956 [Chromobacterium vaccinii]
MADSAELLINSQQSRMAAIRARNKVRPSERERVELSKLS